VTTISEFILDRIGEDEFLAEHMVRRHGARYLRAAMPSPDQVLNSYNPWNVLALCTARRKIVSACRAPGGDAVSALQGLCDTLRELAAEWATHPDYCATWAPHHRVPSQVAAQDYGFLEAPARSW
jgi:hypothetical protein